MRTAELLGLCVIPVLGACAAGDHAPAARAASPAKHSVACDRVAKVIARGARIHGPNGLAVDSDGHLLIASLFGSEFVVMDRDDGSVVRRIDVSALPGPDDPVLAPDGSIYFTSLGTGSVGHVSSGGQITSRFIAPGADGIALSRDGRRLFVGLDFAGDGLYETDLRFETVRAVVPNRPGQTPLGWINGSAFGPDGRLYAPLWQRNMVVSIDVDSCAGSTSPWADCDIRPVAVDVCPEVAGVRGAPTAVKFDKDDRPTLTCVGGQVLRIAPTGAPDLVASLPPGLDNLVFDAQNRLFVSNYLHGSITRVTDGRVEPISPAGMVLPGGVAVVGGPGGGEALYVADLTSLRELSPATGRLLRQSGAFPGLAPLDTPSTVSPDGNQLILTSWFGRQVQLFDPERWQVSESHAMATTPVNAVRFHGAIAVASYDLERGVGAVVQLDTGETILGSEKVSYPLGLAASGDVLYVSDWAAGVVWKVDGGTGSAAPVASGLAHPEGLALDGDGGLLVVESGARRLSRIDLATHEMATVAEGLALGRRGYPPANPPHMTLNGVAVGADGAVYVTGDEENVLYRVEGEGGRSRCRSAGGR